MNFKSKLSEALISFCVCTTCITILEGTIGALLYPAERLPYDAFFAPAIFGALSVLLSVVTVSKRELSVKEIMVRRAIHLLLIEGMVFGLNYLAGAVFTLKASIILAAGIAIVFVAVYYIVWIIECSNAKAFNKQLKRFQEMESQKEID